MKTITIKHRYSSAALFSCEVEDDDPRPMRTAISRANLAGAYLAGAYLADANLADEQLLPMLEAIGDGGMTAGSARQFIAGLREAVELGEDVEFH